MATLKKPRLLLLDEHTAALDPKTAAKVLDATDRIVGEDQLTTLMITHNMKDAIVHWQPSDHDVRGPYHIRCGGRGEEKPEVSDLLAKFEEVSGGEFANDRMMLTN